MDKKSILVIGLMIIMVLTAGFFVLNNYIYQAKQAVNWVEPYRATLVGEQVCLEARDPSKPIPRKCEVGIKTDAGEYFAMNLQLMSQEHPTLVNGTRLSASGVVTPIENLSTDHWKMYNVDGIFSVTDSVVIESIPEVISTEPIATTTDVVTATTTTATTSPDIITKECFVGGCSSQLCTSDPDIASDCMYRPEYACYQGATCEVQADGECAWTETEDLLACLANPSTY